MFGSHRTVFGSHRTVFGRAESSFGRSQKAFGSCQVWLGKSRMGFGSRKTPFFSSKGRPAVRSGVSLRSGQDSGAFLVIILGRDLVSPIPHEQFLQLRFLGGGNRERRRHDRR